MCRQLVCMRYLTRAVALALVLQATSAGFVPAGDMAARAKFGGCPRCQAEVAMPSCHAKAPAQTASRKACCFFGIMPPCADGAVAKARLTSPTTPAAPIALVSVTADWATPDVPVSTAAPPGIAKLTTGPPRTTVLLI